MLDGAVHDVRAHRPCGDDRAVWSILGATALLILVAGFANYTPARRAATVDPGVTLRSE